MTWLEENKLQQEKMENIMKEIKKNRKFIDTILKDLTEKEISYIINNIWK